MKSISRSLVVYFLVLLGLALGAVCIVVYQTSRQALLAKERTSKQTLEVRYNSRVNEEKAKLDNGLHRRADLLVKSMFGPRGRPRTQELYAASLLSGLLASRLSPQGHAQMQAWMAMEGPFRWALTFNRRIVFERDPSQEVFLLGLAFAPTQNPFQRLVVDKQLRDAQNPWGRRQVFIKLLFPEHVLPGNATGQETEYCQIFSQSGILWQRSRSLGEQPFPLAKDAATIKPEEGRLEETTLKPGTKVRVLTVKAPFQFRVWRPPPPRRALGGRLPFPTFTALLPPHERNPEYFFIQIAEETHQRDSALAQYKAEYQKDLSSLEDDSANSLATLRQQLLLISLITFAATVVGGFWLVRLGLSPLRNLSEAVSRVSEKDFRLQFGDKRLPHELLPIVERLNQTLELLARAFAREKQAAADISHELRTPLAALLTTTEVALRKPRSPEEYRELLEDCRESGKQMSQLVERMLALARLDAGVDNLRPREVDVAALAQQCAALVKPLAEARGVSLHVHQNGPAKLQADPDKLREVVTNLLHNAIQYNRPDGSIDLTVERNNGSLRLEVRDTGIGIPAAAREHIFERFFRADPSRQADGLHAGLGLAIVKGYIDLMGGTIGVDSTEGQGSTFHVQLPVLSPSSGIFRMDRPATGPKV